MAKLNIPSGVRHSVQNMQNWGFDDDFGMPMVEELGFDGANLTRRLADAMAVKITEVGSVIYIALAPPGTAEATAGWQVRKIDETSGIVITWADGDASFDNVATDLTILNYT